MNRLQRLGLLVPVVALAAACAGETGGTTNTPGPLAYVRYVHAMPDTGAVIVRPVDRVENLTGAQSIAYRGVTPYTGVVPGNRQFKVFPVTTNPALASVAIIDAQVALNAGVYYTIMHSGFARAAAGTTNEDKFLLIEDDPPAVTAGTFALRTIVAAPGYAANQDVYLTRDTTTALPATCAAGTGSTLPKCQANLGYTQDVAALNAIPWVPIDTGAAWARGYATNTQTPRTFVSLVQAGAAPTGVAGAVAGSRFSGSALTAFLFPAGVAGSGAAGGATASYGVDRRP